MLNWLRHREQALDDDAHGIISPSQIIQLLERVRTNHCLLNVNLIDTEDVYTTMILDVDSAHHNVVLDGLNPPEGNRMLAPEVHIDVSTQLNGLDVSFASTIVTAPLTEESPIVEIAPPLRVHYAQNRREHRVVVPMNWPTSATFWLAERGAISGEVRDLSPGGFCVQIDSSAALDRVPPPVPFKLTLANESVVEGEMEICYVSDFNRAKLRQIGTRILTISPHHQRLLDQCVAEIDRQQLRLR